MTGISQTIGNAALAVVRAAEEPLPDLLSQAVQRWVRRPRGHDQLLVSLLEYDPLAELWLAQRERLMTPGRHVPGTEVVFQEWWDRYLRALNGVDIADGDDRGEAVWILCEDLPTWVWSRAGLKAMQAAHRTAAYLPAPYEIFDILTVALVEPMRQEIRALQMIKNRKHAPAPFFYRFGGKDHYYTLGGGVARDPKPGWHNEYCAKRGELQAAMARIGATRHLQHGGGHERPYVAPGAMGRSMAELSAERLKIIEAHKGGQLTIPAPRQTMGDDR